MSKKSILTPEAIDKTDWARVDALTDEEIDLSDDPAGYDACDPESVKVFWAEAKPRKGRGPQKTPTKVQLTLRLSPDVVEYFKATGRGWQSRVDEALKAYIKSRGD